jgi:hypothetical protein
MSRAKPNARLTQELLEMADRMRASGVMDRPTYEKIKLRHLSDAAKTATRVGRDLRAAVAS